MLRGAKTATAGLPEPDEDFGRPGDRCLLLGFDDEPVGIVELTEVRVVPAGEIDLQFARDTLSAETVGRQGYFDPRAVERVIDRHVRGEEDLSRQLWGLLAFTLWHERHVEREPGALRDPRLEAIAS